MPHDARVPFLKGEYMKKRVLAIAAIVVLVGLYVACLVLALIPVSYTHLTLPTKRIVEIWAVPVSIKKKKKNEKKKREGHR